MSSALNFILTAEAVCTFCSLIIIWAIIGGPMRYMKIRYKIFLLLIAASLLGATLDKVLALDSLHRSADPNTENVRLFARALIALTRCLMFASGCYIMARWHMHCNRVKQGLINRNQRLTAFTPSVRLHAKRA